MNSLRKNRLMIGVLSCGYIIIIAIFIFTLLQMPKSYIKIEKKYLDDAKEDIQVAIETALTESMLLTILPEIIEEYPMEIVVTQADRTVYSSIPLLSTNEDLHDVVNSDVTLAKGTGNFSVQETDYKIWYSIYHLSTSEYIHRLMEWQVVLLGAAVLVLLTVTYVMQKTLYTPLQKVEENIVRMHAYDFEHMFPQESSDGVNTLLYHFAENIYGNIRKIEREYTELEQALQIERERLKSTITVSRAFVHDLKSPLHQTMLENEVVIRKLSAKEIIGRKISVFNLERAENLIFQINEILKVMDHNMYELDKSTEHADIIQVIKQSIKLFKSTLLLRGAYITLSTPENLVVEINVPTFKLLLHNILSNAANYVAQDSEVLLEIDSIGNEITIRCTNKSTPQNIERMKRSASLFQNDLEIIEENDFIEYEEINKYSSGNGLLLIRELTNSLAGQYILEVFEDNVCVTIKIPGVLNE